MSKTMAEKAAWRFAEENGFDVVTVSPGMVLGPILSPLLSASIAVLVHLIQGSPLSFSNFCSNSPFLSCLSSFQTWILFVLIQSSVQSAGSTDVLEDLYMGTVHVKDVALAHILAYENPAASGRHLCIESISHFSDFAAKVSELFPEYQIPR